MLKRPLIIIPCVILLLTLTWLFGYGSRRSSFGHILQHSDTASPLPEALSSSGTPKSFQEAQIGKPADRLLPSAKGGPLSDEGDDYSDYRSIVSLSSTNGQYYLIDTRGVTSYNGNLVPHPSQPETWIAAATHIEESGASAVSCTVSVASGALLCRQPAEPLPLRQGIKGQCTGRKADILNNLSGPRDIRLIWGPQVPYVVYSSHSQWACMGVWMQDARFLLDAHKAPLDSDDQQSLAQPREIQRPRGFPYTRGRFDKNYFLFWDNKDRMYVHYDIWPRRSYARLFLDGTVGEDLAPVVAKSDHDCLIKRMPDIHRIKDPSHKEMIHQASNSLALTLCNRNDKNCRPSPENTYIINVFHRQKIINGDHPIYQPHVALFQQESPFALFAITQKPLWIWGRGALTEDSGAVKYLSRPDKIPTNQTEMFYVTSIAWKNSNQTYHGFLDDPLWINFGKEGTSAKGELSSSALFKSICTSAMLTLIFFAPDSFPGSIDVIAADITQDLGLC